MAETKDTKIANLKQKLAEEIEDRKGWNSAFEDATKRASELQAELDECASMNTRLNKTLDKTREKVGTLKVVARFYRAQRDRVDAYLSATLDADERRYGPKTDVFDGGTVRLSTQAVPAPAVEKDRRPRINEPFTRGLGIDEGRSFAGYRDNEPPQDWEEF